MSEVKGQLLGIILVIMLFGIVATALTGVFDGLTSSVSNEVMEITSDLSATTYNS